jgi:hypothetical protein
LFCVQKAPKLSCQNYTSRGAIKNTYISLFWHLNQRRFTYLVNERCRVAPIGLLESASTVTIAFKILFTTNDCIRTMWCASEIEEAIQIYCETIRGKSTNTSKQKLIYQINCKMANWWRRHVLAQNNAENIPVFKINSIYNTQRIWILIKRYQISWSYG